MYMFYFLLFLFCAAFGRNKLMITMMIVYICRCIWSRICASNKLLCPSGHSHTNMFDFVFTMNVFSNEFVWMTECPDLVSVNWSYLRLVYDYNKEYKPPWSGRLCSQETDPFEQQPSQLHSFLKCNNIKQSPFKWSTIVTYMWIQYMLWCHCQGAQNTGLTNRKLKSALQCTVWSQCTPVPGRQTGGQTDEHHDNSAKISSNERIAR